MEQFVPKESLGRRVQAGIWRGQPAVCKYAGDEAGQDRLTTEAKVLAALSGLHAPRLLAVVGRSTLIMQRLFGHRPDLTAPALMEAMTTAAASVHAHNWIHCDLKPSNIIIGDQGEVWFLDWEHALPRGTDLATCARRAWSPGRSHPDLIWGRGSAEPEIDLWSLAQLGGTRGEMVQPYCKEICAEVGDA